MAKFRKIMYLFLYIHEKGKFLKIELYCTQNSRGPQGLFFNVNFKQPLKDRFC